MSSQRGSSVDALGSAARQRLARFADAFERVDSDSYILLADVPTHDGRPDAVEAEVLARLSAGRRAAVEDAARAFQQELETNLARRMPYGYRFMLTPGTIPTRPEDVARVMAGIRRAVIAVALGDQLSTHERSTLLGRWERVAARAGIEA